MTTQTDLPPKAEPEAQLKREIIEPRSEIEKTLARIFSEVLKVENIGIHDNFFKLGGKSLAVMRAMDLIHERLKQKVNVKDFYSYGTVEELGRLIQEGRSVDEVIDLNREAVLDDDIRPCGSITAPDDCSNILLTGCTGFVGKFLLRDLLEKTEAAIYCLVRADSKTEAMKRIKTGMREFELWKPKYEKRIVPVSGDLSQPELGADPDTYHNLSDTIDVIYHCATYMNHLATYREMKNTTVDGQKRLIRFACAGKQKMIHYISTLSIFNGSQSRQINETTPIELEVHHNSTGYAASKWVADQLMILAWKRGIPGNIYRLGLVTGDCEKGRYDKTQSFYGLLETCLELGCFDYEDPEENKRNLTPG